MSQGVSILKVVPETGDHIPVSVDTEVVTMLRTNQFSTPKRFAPSFPGLLHRDRSIKVRILDGGHEVDSFEVSTAEVLRSEMKAINAHLPKRGALVQFQGVEKQSLPLGIGRVRREIELGNLHAALSFLAA